MMKQRDLLLKWVVYGLVLVYLLNCFSPLRLHVDMLRYFAIKDCIELGCPSDSFAAGDYLPYGYTILLLVLSKLSLLHSFVLVFINCIYLFGSLLLIRKIFGNQINFFLLGVLVLLNWTIIKFVTHPLSEMQFLFFSMASLYFFRRYSDTRRLLSLILSFAMCALAFLTRSAGLALAAALVAGLLWLYREQLLLLMRRNKILVVALVLVLACIVVFSRLLGLDHYTSVFTKQFREGLQFSTMLKWHFTEWSEIAGNTSIVKIFPFVPASVAKTLFFGIGVLLVAGFLWLLFARAKGTPMVVKLYLLFYTVLMFDWPFYDPRFWVPVLPLIAAVIAGLPFPKRKLYRAAVTGWFAVYLVLGVVSAAYMTYTSLNRRVMARTHANGVYRNEYETVFFGKPQSDTARRIDPEVLSVIRRYN